MNNVRETRLMIGISMETLSKHVGCTRETIRKIEIGQSLPNVLLAIRIADVLGPSVEYLFGVTK